MLPIPEKILKRFPCRTPSLPVPGRPWWRRVSNLCYLRSDTVENTFEIQNFLIQHAGRPTEVQTPYYHHRVLGWLHQPDPERDFKEDLAEYDRLYPIPHPEFRVGQVWVSETDTALILDFDRDGYPVAYDHEVKAVWTPDLRYSYLMTDPSCPWLAPWAPAKMP